MFKILRALLLETVLLGCTIEGHFSPSEKEFYKTSSLQRQIFIINDVSRTGTHYPLPIRKPLQ